MNNKVWTKNNSTNQWSTQQAPFSWYTLQMESVPFDKFHFYLPKIPPTWKLPLSLRKPILGKHWKESDQFIMHQLIATSV